MNKIYDVVDSGLKLIILALLVKRMPLACGGFLLGFFLGLIL